MLFLKEVNIRDWNFQFKGWYLESLRYSNDFLHKTEQKRIEKIIFPYGNKIYIYPVSALTWKVEHEGGSFVKLA